jgi:glutamine amidotransferase
MARLFACISNQPHRLAEALEPVRAALVAQGPVSRWGVGYVHSGEVLLSLAPSSVEGDLDFFPTIAELSSDYVIGCASPEDGLRGQANTQPFRYRRWMFAQEGSLAGFEELLPSLVQHIPDFLRRNLHGRSSAEHVFHLFLAMLHDAGMLDDPNLGTAPVRRAVRDAAAFVGQLAARSGRAAELGNLVVTNGRVMVAARLDGPLFVRRLKHQSDPKRPESQFRSVLMVSAAESPGEGFEALPARSAICVARDLATDVVELEA